VHLQRPQKLDAASKAAPIRPVDGFGARKSRADQAREDAFSVKTGPRRDLVQRIHLRRREVDLDAGPPLDNAVAEGHLADGQEG
jgi:hypothetical protein